MFWLLFTEYYQGISCNISWQHVSVIIHWILSRHFLYHLLTACFGYYSLNIIKAFLVTSLDSVFRLFTEYYQGFSCTISWQHVSVIIHWILLRLFLQRLLTACFSYYSLNIIKAFLVTSLDSMFHLLFTEYYQGFSCNVSWQHVSVITIHFHGKFNFGTSMHYIYAVQW